MKKDIKVSKKQLESLIESAQEKKYGKKIVKETVNNKTPKGKVIKEVKPAKKTKPQEIKVTKQQFERLIENINKLQTGEIDEGWLSRTDPKEKRQELINMLNVTNDSFSKNFFTSWIEQTEDAGLGRLKKQIIAFGQRVAPNPNRLRFFKQIAQESAEKAVLLLDFYLSNSPTATPAWDEKKQNWINKALPTSNSPGGGQTNPSRI